MGGHLHGGRREEDVVKEAKSDCELGRDLKLANATENQERICGAKWLWVR